MTDPNSPIIDFYPIDFEVDMNGKRFSWQSIAKLPFIDEARLLAEVAKIEYTLTEEEARRNSVMFDMLFVASSHQLSVCIYSIDNRVKKLTNEARAEIKEPLKPELSGGMNGYISPCAGDPCPPFFRSPVADMEDIMNNEVLCVIYKLPDAHDHIPRPLAGVKFPKRMVQPEDVKPVISLWHEDNRRRDNDERSHYDSRREPYDNYTRPNPAGSLSGRHIGEAAHRLVANSLQNRGNNSYALAPTVTNYQYQGQYGGAPSIPAGVAYPPEGRHYGYVPPYPSQEAPVAYPYGNGRNYQPNHDGGYGKYPPRHGHASNHYGNSGYPRSYSNQYSGPPRNNYPQHARGNWNPPRSNYNNRADPPQSSNPYSALDRRSDKRAPLPRHNYHNQR